MRGNVLDLEFIKSWDAGHEDGVALGEARQIIRSVEKTMEIHQITLEMACDYAAVTIEEYENAKKLLSKSAQS